jgi:hypothetical protein
VCLLGLDVGQSQHVREQLPVAFGVSCAPILCRLRRDIHRVKSLGGLDFPLMLGNLPAYQWPLGGSTAHAPEHQKSEEVYAHLGRNPDSAPFKSDARWPLQIEERRS